MRAVFLKGLMIGGLALGAVSLVGCDEDDWEDYWDDCDGGCCGGCYYDDCCGGGAWFDFWYW